MKIVKAGLIIAVFLFSTFVLMVLKDQSPVDRILHDVIFLETAEDWGKCGLGNCSINGDSLAVEFEGSVESDLLTFPVKPGFEFDQLILSWNVRYSGRPFRLDFYVDVSGDSLQWHRFDYLFWGDSAGAVSTGERSIGEVGRVNVDVLELSKPMKYARVYVKTGGGNGSGKAFLRRLALAFSTDNPSWKSYRQYHESDNNQHFGSVKLSVPYITQRSLAANKEGGACSPTSVSMVLNYHIPGIDPEAFAWSAYDFRNGIFGNWPYNVQAAFASGLQRTWVERHCGFDEIYYEVSTGRPVVISIAYGYDELPNSPIHGAENGHLVVVIGFDGPDSVICNDPAGHGVDDGIVKYPKKELERAWIGHTGVAYHLWP